MRKGKRTDAFLSSLLVLGVLLMPFGPFTACGKKEATVQPPPPQMPPVAKPAQSEEEGEKEIPIYVYSGDRFRDPFTPMGLTTSYQPDALFDPQRAKVKAIIFGKKFKTAAITVSGVGSYFIKEGRIFDIMGKNVDGFKAKVFINKVVVLGDTGDVFELYIRESEEENT